MTAGQPDVIVVPADPNCQQRLETELAARRRLLPTKKIRRFADLETACRDAAHLCSPPDHPPSAETTVSD